MLKILIVDDEAAAGNILKVLIEKQILIEKEIVYCNSPEAALEMLLVFKPGLVMLDIEMPGMNGFDFLNSAANWDFDVIFTTAFDKYAIKAIRFSALDYLLKPVDIVELQNAINRHIIKKDIRPSNEPLYKNLIANILQKNPANFKLAVSVKEGVFLFEPKNIICLEGQNNYSKIYFDDRKHLLVSKTLKEYDDILTEHHFVRVHKSFLVNELHVKKIDNEGMLWLTNDVCVPISRRKKTDVFKIFQ